MHGLAAGPMTSASRRLTTATCAVTASLRAVLLLSLPTAME
jgi:hypothetical protein